MNFSNPDILLPEIGFSMESIVKYYTCQPSIYKYQNVQLNLNRCKINNDLLKDLVTNIAKYKPHKIEVLNLGMNHFDDEGCEHIASLIRMNKDIQSIVLSENIFITVKGFRTIMKAVTKENIFLTKLNFDRCSINIGNDTSEW